MRTLLMPALFGSRHGRQPPRRRGGFGFFGPFPTYSTRTRGGTRVSVGGCCLPFALGLVAVPLLSMRILLRRSH